VKGAVAKGEGWGETERRTWGLAIFVSLLVSVLFHFLY